MHDAASDRAFVTHLNVADQTGSVGKRREPALDHTRTSDLLMLCQRSDRYLTAPFLNEGQFGNSADVDKNLGCGPPVFHHWNQALPAGKNFRVARMFLQEVYGVSQRSRYNVLE